MRRSIVNYSKRIPPPYNPGFGTSPPVLAGRDELLTAFDLGIETGPRSPWFVHALVGDRGVGKTSLLNAFQDHAKARGWPVVAIQVVHGELLIAPLLRDMVKEAGSTWSKISKSLKSLNLEIMLGVDFKVAKAEARVAPGTKTAQPLSVVARDVFQMIGEHAKSQGKGLLITLDEAHSLNNRAETAALASVLQTTVKRNQLPIAVCFAGLPQMRSVFLEAGTFLERMQIDELGGLSRESATLALVQPAMREGVLIDDDALSCLVESADGYPYLVQLVGFHAWEAMGSGRKITLAAANAGVIKARAQLEDVFESRWKPLSGLERAYMQVVARAGGGADSQQISAALGRTNEQLSSTRAELINKHRLLHAPRRGRVVIALAAFGPWIADQPDAVV
jgi:hypothetical protein